MPWIGPVQRSISFAVDQDAISIAGDGRVEDHFPVVQRQPQTAALNSHPPPAHRVASDLARVCNDVCLAGEPEIALEMLFVRRRRRKTIHSLDNLDHAFLALALLLAGGRDLNAQLFGVIKQRRPRGGGGRLSIDGQHHRHAAHFLPLRLGLKLGPYRFGNLPAEPSRSSSSLQRHWAR